MEGFGLIVCWGDFIGFIEVDICGGILFYGYSWIGMDVDIEDIFNILVGVYCLVVDDVNVCFYDIIFILSELFVLSVVIVVEVEDICEGG